MRKKYIDHYSIGVYIVSIMSKSIVLSTEPMGHTFLRWPIIAEQKKEFNSLICLRN